MELDPIELTDARHRGHQGHAGADGGAHGRLHAGRGAARRARRRTCWPGWSRCASAAACAAWPRSSITAAPASRANGMGVWAVPDGEILDTGRRMAAFRGIATATSARPTPTGRTRVFTMAHGRSKEECDAVLDAIAEATGITERATLYSSTEFKKVRMLYFTDDFKRWEAGARVLSTSSSCRTRARPSSTGARCTSCRAGSTRPCGRCARSAATRSSSSAPSGAELTDVDGNVYVDYVCSWGPLIHGHAHPAVLEAVTEAAAPRHVLRRAHGGRGRAGRGGLRADAVGGHAADDVVRAPRRR